MKKKSYHLGYWLVGIYVSLFIIFMILSYIFPFHIFAKNPSIMETFSFFGWLVLSLISLGIQSVIEFPGAYFLGIVIQAFILFQVGKKISQRSFNLPFDIPLYVDGKRIFKKNPKSHTS